MAELAGVMQRSADLNESLRLWERVTALQPGNARYLNNYGVVLLECGRQREAGRVLRQAIEVDAALVAAHFNLGRLVRLQDGDEAAAAHFARAVELDPAYARGWESLGAAYHRASPDRAAECYRKALAVDPTLQPSLYGLLALALRACDFDGLDELRTRVVDAVHDGAHRNAGWHPCANLRYLSLFAGFPASVDEALREHIAGGLQRAVESAGALPAGAVAADQPERRLRIAYLSPNFGDHPVGHVTLSLLPAHDRERFEVIGLSTARNGSDDSEYARRHRAAADAFHEIGDRPAREAAAFIRSLDIDILIDLDGYMDSSSPPILAFRPAPVQLFWLGHAGSPGLPFIDYLIADRHVVPPGEEPAYPEAVVRLPETYHCADRHPIADACAPRAAWNLPDNGVVFCSFNNPDKIDRRVFDRWMRILAQVDDSVLWLTTFRQNVEEVTGNLRRAAASRGVDPARLVFAERVPDKGDHLARLRHADLMLDTLTLNASTTALDGLWAGVPLVTARGDRFSNRISTSMLCAIGMEDLVCADLDGYERLAVRLARDPAARSELRDRLCANREATPLFDIDRFTRHLETAYANIWARHLRGESPDGFDVPVLTGD